MFVLSEYINIISPYIIFVERFRLKKEWSNRLKNMPYYQNGKICYFRGKTKKN